MGSEISKKYDTMYEHFDQTILTDKLISKLDSYGLAGQKMIRIIRKHKLAIFGSIILQIISNTNFVDDNDIDIVCSKCSPQKMDKICADFFEAGIISRIEIENDDGDDYSSVTSSYVYNFTIINNNKNNICRKIQFIQTQHKIAKFIQNNDLSIVKNYYDGYIFYVNNMDNISKKIAIYDNYDNILKKMRDNTNKKRRIKKYTDRGYTIVNINDKFLNISSSKLDV
jgi:hypothetical protein